jgi:hypothetical protein
VRTRIELCDHEHVRWEYNPQTLIYTLRCTKDARHILETKSRVDVDKEKS